MADTDISNADISDMQNSSYHQDFSVDHEQLDSPQDIEENTYVNSDFDEQLGYYRSIPELKSAVDAKAKWIIGKGFKSNEITEIALMKINGNGKDTFNSILQNQFRISEIGGDSFAEIIRDDDGRLINLKPLNPSRIRTVANGKGLIIRYEQLDRFKKKTEKTFKPEEIFHLMRDRLGDEFHGQSIISSVKTIIDMRNEAMEDYRKLLHRNIYPSRVHHLDTDNAAEISAYKAQVTQAKGQGEDIFVPKGNVEMEIIAVPPNATLNPLPWINQLTQNFYQEVGIPQIIVGGAQEITEASAKIAYLAWEQSVEDRQLYIEEQVLAQLNLEINLEFPASLQNEMLSDNRKAETMQASTPEDTSVTNMGVSGIGNQSTSSA